MNKVIYKYEIGDKNSPDIMQTKPGDTFRIQMIKGAKILHLGVQPQEGVLGGEYTIGMLWVSVDPKEVETEFRHFRLIFNGNRFNDYGLEYIGTYQVHGGTLDLHLFEVIN